MAQSACLWCEAVDVRSSPCSHEIVVLLLAWMCRQRQPNCVVLCSFLWLPLGIVQMYSKWIIYDTDDYLGMVLGYTISVQCVCKAVSNYRTIHYSAIVCSFCAHHASVLLYSTIIVVLAEAVFQYYLSVLSIKLLDWYSSHFTIILLYTAWNWT